MLLRREQAALMRKSITSIVAALLSLNAWADSGASHCNETEKTIFNCSIKGSKKVASVCQGKRLEYRFGPIGSPEFVYPSPDNERADEENFRYSATRSMNERHALSEFRLQFYNENYSYMAYSAEVYAISDSPVFDSSVVVWKMKAPCTKNCRPKAPYQAPEGKVIKRFVCSNDDAGANLIDLHNQRAWKLPDLEPTND